MKSAIACPPTEELAQLLTGGLAAERQDECVRHMDSCECCQAKLESIAVGESNLSQVVEHLDREQAPATSAFWPALKTLEREAAAGGDGFASNTPGGVAQTIDSRSPEGLSIAARVKSSSFTFLQPAADPAYLGRLDHFDVMRILGRGGMGVVLEAFDSKLRRNVALKVLDPELADDEIAKQRFCREARAAASISHENVVAVHQVEKTSEGRVAYLVMQLISGDTLEQRLQREQKLPIKEVVRIGMQAAHGLAAAHAQGLIHRDIKPGNILLEPPHDRVKLTDFGLARIEEDVKLTRTGFVSGTPLYMAPEQALGEEPDQRSDLFSLGAVLYEMAVGRPPFMGNSALAILKQIAEVKPKPLRESDPRIPQWFADTVQQLLEKKPEQRIQTAAQLAELFDFEWALLKTSSDDVPEVCEIEQRKQRRRNRLLAGVIAAAALGIGLLAGALLRSPSTTTEPAVSSAEPVAVFPANAGGVWSTAFDGASRTLAMGIEDGSVRLWDLPTKSVKATLPAHRGTVWVVRFTHQSDLLVSSGDDGQVKLWKPNQAEPLRTFQHDNAARGMVISADDQVLYVGDRGGVIRAWSLAADDAHVKPLAEAKQNGVVYSLALSPDGATLASGGNDYVVRLWNAKTLAYKLPLEGHKGSIWGMDFHRDGRRLATASWDRTVKIWDTTSGQLLKSWQAHNGDVWGVDYSPDGSKLATGGNDGAVKLWNAETGELLATFLGHDQAIHGVAFNGDGTLLASVGRDGAARVWEVK